MAGRIASSLLFVLVASYVVASFFPEHRVWGIHLLAFLPPEARWVAVVMMVVLIVPGVRKRLEKMFIAYSRVKPGTRTAIYGGFVLAWAAAFWIFRVRTFFLGDGAVYLSEIFRLRNHLPFSREMLFAPSSAPLTGALHAGFASLLGTTAPDSILSDARFTFWVVGVLAGVVALWIIRWFTLRWTGDGAERFAAGFLLGLAPGAIFFFGYIEYYAPVYCVLLAYFAACLLAARRELPLWVPALLLALAAAFHFMALAGLPALIVLVADRKKKEVDCPRSTVMRALAGVALVLAAAGAWYFLSGVYRTGSRNIISLYPFATPGGWQRYTLLSTEHLVDLVNVFLLVAGPVIVGLLALARTVHWRNRAVLVAAVNAFFFSCVTVFGYASFGLARDWDISAPTGLALAFLLVAGTHSARRQAKARTILLLVGSFTAVTGLVWLGVNIQEESSVNRARTIMNLDASLIPGDGALNGYEHLRKWYFRHQQWGETVWAIEKKIECVGYPSDYRLWIQTVTGHLSRSSWEKQFGVMLNRLESQLGRFKECSCDSLYAGYKKDFEEIAAEVLLEGLLGVGKDFALRHMARFENMFGEIPAFNIVRAEIGWMETPKKPPVELYLEAGRAIHRSPFLAVYAAKGLIASNRLNEARKVLERAVAVDSSAGLPYFYLAYIEYVTTRNIPQVRNDLLRFLRDPKSAMMPQAEKAKAILRQIDQAGH